MKYILIPALLLVTGCATAPAPQPLKPETTVEVITTVVYPEFPDIPLPPKVRLTKFEADMPRVMNELTVKNITECVRVPEAERDERFWARCGENPIDVNSNIFIGFDQENWNRLNINLKRLQENDHVLRRLLEQANAQRSEWRRLAEEERTRVDSKREEILDQPDG
jgi:hypothetical protein